MNRTVKFQTFGKCFSLMLEQAGLNPNSLARRLNEDPSTIHKIVNGKVGASNRLMLKFINVPELAKAGLTLEQMERWKALDRYPDLTGVESAFEESLILGGIPESLTLEQTIEAMILKAIREGRELTDEELLLLTRMAVHERPELRRTIREMIEGPNLQVTTINIDDIES